jgi:hypothetical protein
VAIESDAAVLEGQARAWKKVFDVCRELGMGEDAGKSGVEQVTEFIGGINARRLEAEIREKALGAELGCSPEGDLVKAATTLRGTAGALLGEVERIEGEVKTAHWNWIQNADGRLGPPNPPFGSFKELRARTEREERIAKMLGDIVVALMKAKQGGAKPVGSEEGKGEHANDHDYGRDIRGLDEHERAGMGLERAREIAGAMHGFFMRSMGIGEGPAPDLAGYSLREMVEAQEVVERENARGEEEGKRRLAAGEKSVTRTVQCVCDPRLTAAMYVFHHFETEKDAAKCEPILALGGKALVLVEVGSEETEEDTDEHGPARTDTDNGAKRERWTESQVKKMLESPALVEGPSEHYPAWFKGRVPKVVQMYCNVRSDIPLSETPAARDGKLYPVWVNRHGAVSAIHPDGQCLGLKPGEYSVVEWHAGK